MSIWTNNWAAILISPITYATARKSISKSLEEYKGRNPPGNTLTGDSVATFERNRSNWIDACTSALKSEDVGRSKANCNEACTAGFDNDAGVLGWKADNQEVIEENAAKQAVRNQKLITILIGSAIAFAVFYYFFFT